MTGACRKNLFTIPAGVPFARALARGIIAQAGDAPDALTAYTILLPTRRAVRTVRDAFLRESGGKPILLPRLQPLGDVEEEELSLILAAKGEDLGIPSAIPPLRRQIMLARLIGGMKDFTKGPAADLALARALGQLMDQVYTEDLDLSALPTLVDVERFADHWQITLSFLSLLSVHWPQILAEEGMIDAADRRNRLIKALAAQWRDTPPAGPVIAAGSTGSIPATARLLDVIASMENGAVVLPGLDRAMDDESWDAVTDTHPQATLKTLLHQLGCPRTDVLLWQGVTEQEAQSPRQRLATEIMRPAETTAAWRDLSGRNNEFDSALEGITRYDCPTPQEEAQVIATAMRETLENGDRIVALITPDRALARRVAMACRRWGIEIDDSAGARLTDTRVGGYLRLAVQTVADECTPVPLLAFLKSALAGPDSKFYKGDWRGDVRLLDRRLRGPWPRRGLAALTQKIERVPELKEFSNFLPKALAPLEALAAKGSAAFSDWLEAHLALAETICPPERLWAEEDGEQAAAFFATLREEAPLLPSVSVAEYAALLDSLMLGVTVRPAYGRHPRLMILGQLESRMIQADRVILGGLNEGTWPPGPPGDPWMSRGMRTEFGLPGPDRSIGLSAHDFVQGFAVPDVILTRSLRVNGTPSVPARWLLRFDTVLQALGRTLSPGPHAGWAAHLDDVRNVSPVKRPAPTPPVAARPRELPVTQIEAWLNDPYSVYARYVLRLKPLKSLEQPVDAAIRGTLLHKMMDKFVQLHPKTLPQDVQGTFLTIAADELKEFSDDPALWSFWQPRLSRLGEWIGTQEGKWRGDWQFAKAEAEGHIDREGPAGAFTLTARADRIDLARDGSAAAIIDYKSGGKFTKKGMANGTHPQLPLEALILSEGGFEGIAAKPVGALAYWVLRGGSVAGETTVIDKEVDAAVTAAKTGLDALIATFDRETTPYYSLPDLARRPRFNDFEHLARVKEWTALGDDESEEAA